MTVDVESRVALALRELQKLDQVTPLTEHRHHLIRAETLLGEQLGLMCTGEAGGWYDEEMTKPCAYDHNGDTCPVHEWLVESDAKGIE